VSPKNTALELIENFAQIQTTVRPLEMTADPNYFRASCATTRLIAFVHTILFVPEDSARMYLTRSETELLGPLPEGSLTVETIRAGMD
jgi:hypothetical protein